MLNEVASFALTVLAPIGTAGFIVLAFSNWLGKVWANRLMETERHRHEQALTELRAKLEQTNQQSIEFFKSDLNIFKEKHLKGFHDKIQVYRLMIDIISDILGDFDSIQLTGQPLPRERFDTLNRARIRIYGYIGMIAPQAVMNAQDQLMDYLLEVADGNKPYVWVKVREFSLALINEVRKDIGIDVDSITYNGNL